MNDAVTEEVLDHQTLDSIYPGGQIRLAELSVCNWANFQGVHTAQFDPGGTLVSGLTGAGKSSFIDALQLLLLTPSRTIFNIAAAQGDGRDRDKMSYVRGVYGSTGDSNGRTIPKYKRDGDVLSGIRGYFRSEDGSLEVTLACFMRALPGVTANGDVLHHYVVAHRNVSLKDMVDMIRKHSNVSRWAGLTKMFGEDEAVHICPTFQNYEVYYRSALRIEDDKAPALLIRAMGLKKIDNLTELIRKLVLEDPDTGEKAKDAIREFENLNLIHSEFIDARNRRDALERLPELSSRLQQSYAERDSVLKQLSVFDVWFSRQRVAMLSVVEQEVNLDLQQLEERKSQVKLEVEALHRQRMDIEQLYRDKGGDRIDNLKENLRNARRDETETQRRLKELKLMLGNAGTQTPDAFDADSFLKMKRALKERGHDAAKMESVHADGRDALTISKAKVEDRLREASSELDVLNARPGSAIDWHYQTMREDIARDTGVPVQNMPFIGELIEIKQGEQDWQGAIERALGFLRLRLLISPSDRDVVARYINDNHMGRRVGFEVVRTEAPETVFRPESFLMKLNWANNPHKYWLRRFLSEQSLDCVDSVEQMKSREYSMTRSGLIQRRKGSFDKNDAYRVDDRTKWYIGFSNQGRRAALAEEVESLKSRVLDLTEQRKEAEQKLRQIQTLLLALNQVEQLEFERVDVAAAHAKCMSIQADIDLIEKNSSDLRDLQQRLTECIQAYEAADARREDIQGKCGRVAQRLGDVRAAIEVQKARAAREVDESVFPVLAAKIPALTIDQVERAEDIEVEGRRRLDKDLRGIEADLGRIKSDLAKIIGGYKAAFKGAAVDLPDHNSEDDELTQRKVVAEWVDHFLALVKGKLPELKDRFEISLRRQATQSLTVIFQSIENQSEAIEERIDDINKVLMKAEFLPGAFMQLEASDLQNEDVRKFESQWDEVRKQAATSADPEAHFAALKKLILSLQVATDPNTRNNASQLPLLDARYRKAFVAPLVNGEGVPLNDTWSDTKGRSGGEKEGFSGFIVAAALAYVLTPQGHGRPTYGTVFLDEAFSNTSDERAARVMQVFKEFGLHLNLITPFKQIEVSSRAMAKAVVVEMTADKESRLMDITWEKAREQQRRLAEREALEQMKVQRL